MNRVLTTRELADAIGVSESSIKRWADEGQLRAARTAGGHRRIALAEAIRFVRSTRMPVLRPDVLGLADAGALKPTEDDGDETDRLWHSLLAGDAAAARGLVQSLYVSGWSVADILDGPVRTAMSRLGELWRHQNDGVFLEHRATDACLQSLHHLRLLLPPPHGAPVAVGGAPEGDPYLLPSLAAATVLAGEGYAAVNLGPETPLATLELAAERVGAALTWVSVTGAPWTDRLAASLGSLVTRMGQASVRVVIGGQGVPAGAPGLSPEIPVGRSMAELAAFARGLAHARTGTVEPDR